MLKKQDDLYPGVWFKVVRFSCEDVVTASSGNIDSTDPENYEGEGAELPSTSSP